MIQFPSIAQAMMARQIAGSMPGWVSAGAIMSLDAKNDRYWQAASIARNANGGIRRQATSTGLAQKQNGDWQTFKGSELRLTNKGLFNEVQRQNRLLYNRDLTNAAWVKTNIAAIKDQAGALQAEANGASRIVATADAANVTQAATFSSSRAIASVHLKRLVGIGTVEITMDGTTWTAVTLTTDWQRFALPAVTQTNATFGIRLGTSGDSVALDNTAVETGSAGPDVPSSPIECTSSSVTRQADRLRFRAAEWVPSAGSCVIQVRAVAGVDKFGALSSSPARFIQFSDGTGTRTLFATVSSTQISVQQSNSGGTINLPYPGDMSVVRLAFAWKNNSLRTSVNGGDPVSATGFLEKVFNLVTLGHDYNNNGTNALWGTIETVEVFADDPSDAVLKARSVVV